MYNSILRLYKKTGNKDVVTKALEKGWITEAEANEILGEE